MAKGNWAQDKGSDTLVLVIGAAGWDMVGRLEQEPEQGTSTPARIRMAYGGVARNVAENLARLGQPCMLLSAVGDDLEGNGLRRELTQAGVDVSSILVLKEETTGAYLAIVDTHGRLRMALDEMHPLLALTPDWLKDRAELFRQAGMVFFDANLQPESIQTIIELAERNGVPVCADPASRHLASRLIPHLASLSVLLASAGEAEALLGRSIHPEPSDAVTAARELVSRGARIAVISLDEFGVAYASRDEGGHISALRTAIVDPTGAGDALTAAFLTAQVNGVPLDESVRLGISAASLTLRSKKTVVPDLSLERLYDEMM